MVIHYEEALYQVYAPLPFVDCAVNPTKYKANAIRLYSRKIGNKLLLLLLLLLLSK